MNAPTIFPILFAAGKSPHLPFPKALADFAGCTAVEIAVRNCRGLERPIVVLEYQADRLRRALPRQARVTVNRLSKPWRRGTTIFPDASPTASLESSVAACLTCGNIMLSSSISPSAGC